MRESARESERARERERERLRSTRVSVVEPARWSVASRTPTVLPAVSACVHESKETYYKAKRDQLRSKRALLEIGIPVSACGAESPITCIMCVCVWCA